MKCITESGMRALDSRIGKVLEEFTIFEKIFPRDFHCVNDKELLREWVSQADLGCKTGWMRLSIRSQCCIN